MFWAQKPYAAGIARNGDSSIPGLNRPIISAFADESSEKFGEQIDAVLRNGITHIELREVDGTPAHKQSLEVVRSFKQAADDACGVGECP